MGPTNITGDSVPYRTSSDENLAQLSSIAVRAKVTSSGGQKMAQMQVKNYGGSQMNADIPTTSPTLWGMRLLWEERAWGNVGTES